MKVIHAVRQFLPSRGGLEEAVLKLSQHQSRRHGCDVRVITLDRVFSEPDAILPSREVVGGVQVERIPFRGSRRYPVAPSILHRLGEADIVHVHAVDFFYDFLALTKPLHRKPLIATTHGGFFHTSFAAGLKRFYFATATRVASSRYDRIVACSDSDASMFRRIAPRKVVTIENGVDLAKFRACASPAHRRTLIYFGRLASNKRIDRLFPILRHLRDESDEWRLIVAGTAHDVTVAALRAGAAQCGVAAAVDFIDSPSDEDLARVFGEATYFISASAYEGFGIAALEAMSAGLIPILSRVPSFQSFIERAKAGLLIEPSLPKACAQSIRNYVHRAELSVERSRITKFAEARDWARTADAYFAQYERIRTDAGAFLH
jgi:alpha-1,3-mannosyltransferase